MDGRFACLSVHQRRNMDNFTEGNLEVQILVYGQTWADAAKVVRQSEK